MLTYKQQHGPDVGSCELCCQERYGVCTGSCCEVVDNRLQAAKRHTHPQHTESARGRAVRHPAACGTGALSQKDGYLLWQNGHGGSGHCLNCSHPPFSRHFLNVVETKAQWLLLGRPHSTCWLAFKCDQSADNMPPQPDGADTLAAHASTNSSSGHVP